MSLVSTVTELREWAEDFDRRPFSGPTDDAEFLRGVADELAEYAEDVWLVVVGDAKNQKVLDGAVTRLRAAVGG